MPTLCEGYSIISTFKNEFLANISEVSGIGLISFKSHPSYIDSELSNVQLTSIVPSLFILVTCA